MKLSTREDIEAPIDYVFDKISDFSLLERSAMRRGVEVVRRASEGHPCWELGFTFRGKARKASISVSGFDRPNAISADFLSGGLQGRTIVDLVALSRNRTRIAVAVEMSPHSLSARLLLQSLRLAKMTVQRRFKTRIADIAEEIEESYGR